MYQIKAIKAEISDIDEASRTVKGYFSIFGNVDSDGDIIMPGAFAKTISERGRNGTNRIKHLWQHNPTMPLGVPTLSEDEKGLAFETTISDTSYGMDAIKLYRDGVIDEHSIGFEVIKGDYSETRKAYMMTEVKLWEGSTVTWGANEFARGGMKSASTNADWLKERYDILKSAMKSGDYTDETFKLIEKQLNWISRNYFEQTALKSNEPPDGTPSDIEPQLLEQLQLINLKRAIRYGN